MIDLLNDMAIVAKPGKKHRVADFDPAYKAHVDDKKEAKAMLDENITRLQALQDKLYADDKHSLLIIFQAMDAAGKDGTIKHVMSGVNPQGCQVFNFKQPSAEELDHDYFWRCYKALPERGRIGIFNRSYYEEVLITHVHPEVVMNQKLPGVASTKDVDEAFFKKRYESINTLEKHLCENGTQILKFFLNVSKEEQKERFLKRIDDPTRNWKFSATDLKERGYWDQYMEAYSAMLSHTSTEHAPWFVIPADRKWFMRLSVSNIIVKALERIDPQYPSISSEQVASLLQYREALLNE